MSPYVQHKCLLWWTASINMAQHCCYSISIDESFLSLHRALGGFQVVDCTLSDQPIIFGLLGTCQLDICILKGLHTSCQCCCPGEAMPGCMCCSLQHLFVAIANKYQSLFCLWIGQPVACTG